MLIGKNWKIGSDSLNIILYERGTSKKTKEDYWRPHSYYSSIHNALEGIIDQEIKGTGMKDLKTIAQKIDELKALIPVS